MTRARVYYLIRHGETAYTTTRRFCGHRDPPLNRRGLLQAGAVARHLEGAGLVAVYASDLLRARETAAAIAAPHGLPVRVVPGLREMAFGSWEGRFHEDVRRGDEARFAAWASSPLAEPPPGAERFESFVERAWNGLLSLPLPPRPGPVAVVAHGGVLRVLLGRMQGRRPAEIPWAGQGPAALNEAVGDDAGFRILRQDTRVWTEADLAEPDPVAERDPRGSRSGGR